MSTQISRTAFCAIAAIGVCHAAEPDSDRVKRHLIDKYGRSAILFEVNRGQAPQGVEFVARGLGHRILIRPTGVQVFAPGEISMYFAHANSAAHGEALDAIEARSGFMWNGHVIGLDNYKKVRYLDVWPGADVVYYGNSHDLEYDIVLHPGADVKKIKLRFTGVQSRRVNSSGDLVLGARAAFVQRKPHIYQRIGGRTIDVAGGYRVGQDGLVSIEVSRYDHTQTLVIDPTLVYSKSPLDPTIASASGIAVDAAGNAYLTGATSPIAPGGVYGLYILKLDPSGNAVANPFEAGGSDGNTFGNGIAVDGAGNIYVVGQTNSNNLIDVNACPNCGFQSNLANAANRAFYDGFLMALAPTVFTDPTHSINYVTYIGGASNDVATSVAVLSPSTVYVAGTTGSVNFPVSQGPSFQGQQKAFLVNVDTTKVTGPASRVWGIFAGGNGTDSGSGVAVDSSGNAYLVGTTTSATFSPSSSTGFNTAKGANADGYLDKIDPTGQTSPYFTYFQNGQATAVAVVGTTAYVTGQSPGNLSNITAGAAQSTFGGGNSDIFLFRVDTSQTGPSSLIYSSYFGGSGDDVGYGVAADTSGRAYLAGGTTGGLPVKNAMQGTFGGGIHDPFYAVVNTNLSGAASLLSATYLGSSADDLASGVAVPSTGGVAYVSGSVAGAGGAFAAKISEGVSAISVIPSSGSGSSQTFSFGFSDPNGYTSLTTTYMLINSVLNWPASCYSYYDRGANALWLLDDSASFWMGPVTLASATKVQNSQCILNGAGSSVSGSVNNLTVNVALTFKGGFGGVKNVYMNAQDSGGAWSNWQQLGSWTVPFVGNQPPTAVSVTPSSGNGSSQTFSFLFSDPNGYADLSTTYMLVNATLNWPGTCYAYYDRVANALWLLNDAANTWMGPLTPGAAATVQNSQCSLSGAGSSVSGSANNLAINLALTFKAAFGGTKNVYLNAQDSGGLWSNWQQLGSWTVPVVGNQPPTAVSVTPSSGSGSSQTLSFVFSDPNGYTDLSTTYMLVNSTLNWPGTCYSYYDRVANALWLLNDGASFWMGPVTPGAATIVQNSQCSLNGAGSSVTGLGSNLTINLALTFKAAFGGVKNVYMNAQDSGGLWSNWQQRGTWTVPGGGNQPPTAVSVTPSSGSGSSQTFGFLFSDPNGFTDLSTTYMLINSTLNWPGTCYSYYDRAANALWLLNDAANAWLGPVTPGAAATVQNSQCSLNGAGSSVSGSGNNLTINLALTFKAAFAGAKNVYLNAQDSGGLWSNWQQLGAWTVQ